MTKGPLGQLNQLQTPLAPLSDEHPFFFFTDMPKHKKATGQSVKEKRFR